MYLTHSIIKTQLVIISQGFKVSAQNIPVKRDHPLLFITIMSYSLPSILVRLAPSPFHYNHVFFITLYPSEVGTLSFSLQSCLFHYPLSW